MSFQHLTLEHRGHVAVVTLNRPHRANALHYDHLREIEAVALGFRDDAGTRAVVFRGAGNHFCSGADLKERGGAAGAADGPAPGSGVTQPLVLRRRRARIGERAIRAVSGIDQVTIAAWHGAAMGGGACLATAMDLRIGARGCFMQYPEIDIGVNLMWQSLPLLVHLVGPARAKRLVIGGERLHDETLLAWGILDELVAPEALPERALAVAAHYAAKAPIAAQMIKRSVNAISSALDQALMHMDADQNILAAMTADRREAIDAYLAKRPATFTGD
jgi:enoyl-CoA hydratase/carnithine racemase